MLGRCEYHAVQRSRCAVQAHLFLISEIVSLSPFTMPQQPSILSFFGKGNSNGKSTAPPSRPPPAATTTANRPNKRKSPAAAKSRNRQGEEADGAARKGNGATCNATTAPKATRRKRGSAAVATVDLAAGGLRTFFYFPFTSTESIWYNKTS